jgi:hypothetical protein
VLWIDWGVVAICESIFSFFSSRRLSRAAYKTFSQIFLWNRLEKFFGENAVEQIIVEFQIKKEFSLVDQRFNQDQCVTRVLIIPPSDNFALCKKCLTEIQQLH